MALTRHPSGSNGNGLAAAIRSQTPFHAARLAPLAKEGMGEEEERILRSYLRKRDIRDVAIVPATGSAAQTTAGISFDSQASQIAKPKAAAYINRPILIRNRSFFSAAKSASFCICNSRALISSRLSSRSRRFLAPTRHSSTMTSGKSGFTFLYSSSKKREAENRATHTHAP